jgi:hypothetical protein
MHSSVEKQHSSQSRFVNMSRSLPAGAFHHAWQVGRLRGKRAHTREAPQLASVQNCDCGSSSVHMSLVRGVQEAHACAGSCARHHRRLVVLPRRRCATNNQAKALT